MALFLLEIRDFLGFRMIFKVPLFNLYFMVHSNVWKCEKIWLSGTLIIIRKPKCDGQTDGHEDPYIPPTLFERGNRKKSQANVLSTM
jgi:hypothetical protein